MSETGDASRGAVALPPVGRATRTREAGGREHWRLPAGSEAIAQRLIRLGHHGVGGFEARLDGETPTLVRRDLSRHIGQLWRDTPLPVGEVLRVVLPVVRALAYCESRSLFPGPLTKRGVWIGDDGQAGLVADGLVEGLVGSARPLASSGRLSRWTPPGPARGEPWTAASNRYVLGLLLYRALSGVHPFDARGRRLALADGAQRGAPPMPDAVAATLPPGLQSLCLRLLAPASVDRPSIDTVLESLQRFVPQPRAQDAPSGARGAESVDERADARAARDAGAGASSPADPISRAASGIVQARSSGPPGGGPPASPPAESTPSRPGPRSAPRGRAWLALAPAVVGAGTLLAARAWTPAPPQPPAGVPVAASGARLTASQTRADDCGSCHPEHAAQWHGSVMAHSVRSPLFGALEILIEEQVGKDFDCPGGAGVLRAPAAQGACRDPSSGVLETGTGGALWCVNCHAPEENLRSSMPAWDGRSARSASRLPVRDLLPKTTLDGISCAFCHQVHGPAQPGDAGRGRYEGNPDWISPATGRRFVSRPEDGQGRPGIANSGYSLDPDTLLGVGPHRESVPAGAHQRPETATRDYLASSEFCGACHDVRLFGTDARAGQRDGEHFKRLRNAYSEWVDWAAAERRQGRDAASCQDCHMSLYPGVCVPEDGSGRSISFSGTRYTALDRAGPEGTRFDRRAPGDRPQGRVSIASGAAAPVASPTRATATAIPNAAATLRTVLKLAFASPQ